MCKLTWISLLCNNPARLLLCSPLPFSTLLCTCPHSRYPKEADRVAEAVAGLIAQDVISDAEFESVFVDSGLQSALIAMLGSQAAAASPGSAEKADGSDSGSPSPQAPSRRRPVSALSGPSSRSPQGGTATGVGVDSEGPTTAPVGRGASAGALRNQTAAARALMVAAAKHKQACFESHASICLNGVQCPSHDPISVAYLFAPSKLSLSLSSSACPVHPS